MNKYKILFLDSSEKTIECEDYWINYTYQTVTFYNWIYKKSFFLKRKIKDERIDISTIYGWKSIEKI